MMQITAENFFETDLRSAMSSKSYQRLCVSAVKHCRNPLMPLSYRREVADQRGANGHRHCCRPAPDRLDGETSSSRSFYVDETG
jgi:hypothetical protein